MQQCVIGSARQNLVTGEDANNTEAVGRPDEASQLTIVRKEPA